MKQTMVKNLFQKTENEKTHMQWIFTILLNIPMLNYGLQIAWPAYAAKVLQSDESPTGTPLSTFDISWLTSSPDLSSMLGIFIWVILVDKFGRKSCIMSCSVIQGISWIIIVLSTNMTALMIGRIIGGIGGGGCSYIMPIYIKELSQDDIRGILGSIRNMARCLGVLALYLIGGFLTYDTISWVGVAISVASVLSILMSPESPTYNIKIGEIKLATATIARLRCLKVDAIDVQTAVDSLKAEDEKFKSIPSIHFDEICKQKAWCKGFVFLALLMVCYGLNGGVVVINYAPSILEMANVTVSPELLSLSVPILMIVGCLLSIAFIEYGRKPILAVSFFITMVSFSILAAILILQRNEVETPSWLTVTVLVLPVCAHAAGVASIPFVIMAEMFNFQIRAKVTGLLTAIIWGSIFIQTLMFGPVSDAIGPHATFIFYASINLFGALVVLVLLPETKKKSIEEIECELEKKIERQY